MTNEIKPKVNCSGRCKDCMKQEIEYGVSNGSFTYYCHSCKEAKVHSDILAVAKRDLLNSK